MPNKDTAWQPQASRCMGGSTGREMVGIPTTGPSDIAPMHTSAHPLPHAPGASLAGRSAPSRRLHQPVETINVDGALLRLSTVSAIAGRSLTSMARDRAAGLLRVRVLGPRCVRVLAEDARAYLAALAQESA